MSAIDYLRDQHYLSVAESLRLTKEYIPIYLCSNTLDKLITQLFFFLWRISHFVRIYAWDFMLSTFSSPPHHRLLWADIALCALIFLSHTAFVVWLCCLCGFFSQIYLFCLDMSQATNCKVDKIWLRTMLYRNSACG